MAGDEDLRQRARKIAEEKAKFTTHLVVYIAVNVFLIALWWVTEGPGAFPWFVIPLFGWGIGLAAHGIGVYRGESYVEEQAEREYRRLKEKEGR